MIHTRAKFLPAKPCQRVQPGRIAWLRAAGGARQQPGGRRGTHPTRTAQTRCTPPHVGTAIAGHSATAIPRATESATTKPALRMGSEARYLRRWLAPRLPELYEAVLRCALGGDMEATRMLLRMSALDGKVETPKKKPNKVGPGFAKKALEEFRARK